MIMTVLHIVLKDIKIVAVHGKQSYAMYSININSIEYIIAMYLVPCLQYDIRIF